MLKLKIIIFCSHVCSYFYSHMLTAGHTWFSFKRPILRKWLLQVRPAPKSKEKFEIVVAERLQAGCPSCRSTNSVKALKDELLKNPEKPACCGCCRYRIL